MNRAAKRTALVVVENEKMYHTAQTNGPAAMRRPEGLAINSLMEADPDDATEWQIRPSSAC